MFIALYAEIYDPQLARRMERANGTALATLLLPIAFLLNAVVITIFGNSIGKRIFGLKAFPIEPERPPSLWFNIARELRVWCFGYALGIPIVNLFTMSSNFSAIKGGEPARYDVGRARVAQRPISKTRLVIAGLLTAAFAIALATADRLTEMADRKQTFRSAQSSPAPSAITASTRLNWTNPITAEKVGLPVGWLEKPIADQPGQKLSLLESPNGNLAVLLAAEEGGAILTLSTYSLRLSEAQQEAWTNVTVWQDAYFADRSIRHRSMQATEGKTEAGLILWKQGSRFWRILVIDADAKHTIDPLSYPIVRTLMRSVPA